jgi:hypothetical protein
MLSTPHPEIKAFIQNSERRKKKEENIYSLHTNGTLPALRRFLATKTLDSVAFHT